MILAVFGIFIDIKRIYYKLNNTSQVQHRPVSAVKLSWLVLLWFCFVVWCPAEDPWCCSCLLSHLQLIWSSAQTLLVSLLVSLLAARLFRLLDVGRGLSASAPTCDSSLLCLRWLCFPPRLIDSSGSATCLHSSVAPLCDTDQNLSWRRCESLHHYTCWSTCWTTCCITCLTSSHFHCLLKEHSQ